MTDLTDRPVLRRITQFAVPLTLASIFQNLYLLVGSVVVGRFLGVTAWPQWVWRARSSTSSTRCSSG